MADKTLNRLRPGAIAKLAQSIGSHNDGGSLYLVVRKPGRAAWVFKFRDGAVLRSKGLGALSDVTLGKPARNARTYWRPTKTSLRHQRAQAFCSKYWRRNT